MKTMSLKDYGFSGYLENESSNHGVVIIMGGESVGFIKVGKIMAKEFARHGFCALSISLFGVVGLPNCPNQIPIEMAIKAVEYLKKRCDKVSLFGMSMGSVVALACSLHIQVDNLVLMSPSHVSFEAVSKDKKTMLHHGFITWNDEDIPYVCADFSKYKMYDAYVKAYSDKEKEKIAMAALPISKVKARILLLAGNKDTSWPSSYSASMLYNALEKENQGYAYKKIIYPKYGHMLPLKKNVRNEVYKWIEEM